MRDSQNINIDALYSKALAAVNDNFTEIIV